MFLYKNIKDENKVWKSQFLEVVQIRCVIFQVYSSSLCVFGQAIQYLWDFPLFKVEIILVFPHRPCVSEIISSDPTLAWEIWNVINSWVVLTNPSRHQTSHISYLIRSLCVSISSNVALIWALSLCTTLASYRRQCNQTQIWLLLQGKSNSWDRWCWKGNRFIQVPVTWEDGGLLSQRSS